MLQRLLSFCRRLVGGKSAPPSSGEERRVWVRYPSVARTTVQSSVNGTDGLLSARIRNISRGGVNLVVSRAFKLGDMISVDVPGNTSDKISAVLACVIHSRPLPDGHWSLGCAFSEMLDEDDLSAFVSNKERPSGSEKRGSARHSVKVKATYQLVNDPHKESRSAVVVNISLGGVGLQVEQPIDNGTLLNVNLESPAGQVKTILACVVHVLSRTGAGRVLGCNFINELSEADFIALV